MDASKDPLPDDFSASDAFGELENMLQEHAAEQALHDSLEAEELGYEAQVLTSLRELGMDIRVPVVPDAPLYEYGVRLNNLIRFEEGFQGATGIELSEEAGAVKPTHRDVALIFHADRISGAMGFLKYKNTDGSSVATAHKEEAQFEILEDDRITELDKAQLLDVFDTLVPVEGIDMTDEGSFDRLRELSDEDYERIRLNNRAKEIVKGLVEEELVPAFGEHDEYQRFVGSLRIWLTNQRRIATGEVTAEQIKMITDHNMANLLEAATMIGIPEGTLQSFMAKADFLL